jgi:hypothetical protein
MDPKITRCCLGGSPGAMEALFEVRPGALETDQGALEPLPGAFIARAGAIKLTRKPWKLFPELLRLTSELRRLALMSNRPNLQLRGAQSAAIS